MTKNVEPVHHVVNPFTIALVEDEAMNYYI